LRRKKSFDDKAIQRAQQWRRIQGLGIDQTEDYDTCLMWTCAACMRSRMWADRW
jgi:hypothetical protein